MGVYEEEEPSAFQKYQVVIGCGLIAAIATAVWFGHKRFDRNSHSLQEQHVILVNLPPPPLPSPPPPSQLPPPPTETEQKMIEQEPVSEPEAKPDDTTKDKPPVSESPALGTSIQGDGPTDGFGLRGGNSFGSSIGGGTGNAITQGRSGRLGWYASQVQIAISQALQSNTNTRTAEFRVDVQIWSDHSGRITRARIARSTGIAALDNAITNEVLAGLLLQEPPPDGMPMPIVLRLTARNPSMALSR
jgi:protein TonB